MNKKKPQYFSDFFNIDKAKLLKLGVFDPILNFDTKVFVEPLLLKKSSSEIIKNSANNFDQFFIDLLTLLKLSEQEGDKPWREAKRRVYFPEYKYTCIGYGTDSIDGSGSGAELNDKILHSAKDIVKFAKDDPNIFLILPLLEEGVGADIVSDMTQNIIDEDICKFTSRTLQDLELEADCKYKTKSGNVYSLLKNPFNKCPIKLLPNDILSDLPLADSFEEWLSKMADINGDLRNSVNRHIGTSWHDETKSQKKERLLDLLKNDKEFFVDVLKTLKNHDFNHYDIEQDWHGLHRWLKDSEKFIKYKPANKIGLIDDDLEKLSSVVGQIIESYKFSIESEELWRVFWTESYSKLYHVKEFYSQMLFYMVASSWINSKHNNLNCERLFNKETRQIDFKFSVNGKYSVNVQIKNADNYGGLKKSYDKKIDQNISRLLEFDYYLVMTFENKEYKQLEAIKRSQSKGYKIIEIATLNKDKKESDLFEFDPVELDLEGMFTEFENFNLDNEETYFAEKSKGGKKRHEKTDIIKNNIIKLMFDNVALIKGKSTKQRANKIHDLLSELFSNEDENINISEEAIINFANKYDLNINDLRDSATYFSDDKSERIYKWCLDFDKNAYAS
jgi:hypothetical protein